MFKRIRYLTGQSLIYGLGSILTRGISFFLVPLYTQYLSPDAYGVLSVVSSLISVVLGILPMGLPAAALRFYFDSSDDQQRQITIGSIWRASLLPIVGLTVVLLIIGPFVSPWLFPDVPFAPFLVLALFTACARALGMLPLALFRSQENVKRYVTFSVGTFLIITLFSIGLVAGLRLGALGALIARLIGPTIAAIGATILLVRYTKLHFQPAIARAGFLFGIPLVPATLFGWVLRFSDRIIMQQYVSLADIGIYSLGYQLGSVVSLLGTAINSAWSPFYYRTIQEHGDKSSVVLAPIITYFMMVVIAIGLAIATLSSEVIQILVQPAYYAAYLVTPWIIASSVIQVFTWISRKGITYSKKTYWEPLLSLVGGGVSIGINLLLLPRVGYIAAGYATLSGFAARGILAFAISQRVYPITYEYRRLVTLVIAAISIFFASQAISLDSIWLSIAVKIALLGLYPMLLWIFGFVSDQERSALYRLYTRIRQKSFPLNDHNQLK